MDEEEDAFNLPTGPTIRQQQQARKNQSKSAKGSTGATGNKDVVKPVLASPLTVPW